MHLRALLVIVIAASVAVGMAGCGGGVAGRITHPSATLPEKEDSAAFLDRISSQPDVSENDAMRGILLLLDGKDIAGAFENRVKILRKKDIIDAGWDYDAKRPITRGKFAYMIYQACGIPGGVTLQLVGPTQRYCLRELQYREVMAEGAMFSPMTGMEYIAVLGRADVYIRTGKIPDKSGAVEGE